MQKRADRRKAQRQEERRRAEEIDRTLTEPPLRSFEKPATGKIVESPRVPWKKRDGSV